MVVVCWGLEGLCENDFIWHVAFLGLGYCFVINDFRVTSGQENKTYSTQYYDIVIEKDIVVIGKEYWLVLAS